MLEAMTDERLNEIEARVGDALHVSHIGRGPNPYQERFESHAYDDVPALVAEVRRLREVIDGPHLAPPLVIEDQGGASTEWVISFAGLHPSDKECVTVHDGPTAFKLASLVRRLVASRERSLREIVRQHEERGGDE